MKPKPGENPNQVANVATKETLNDTLISGRNLQTLACVERKCGGALMGSFGTVKRGLRKGQKLAHAKDFFEEYFTEVGRKPEFDERWAAVKENLTLNGHFQLTLDELAFGAKTAWRNAARCSGRSVWKDLVIRDKRKGISSCDEVFEEIKTHIVESFNNGSIKPTITLFPERQPDNSDQFRMWNAQLFMYAGYWIDEEATKWVGDKANIEFTEFCQTLGWAGKGTRFDVLPLVISGPDGKPHLYEIPEEIVPRVKIAHPRLEAIAELELEWYGLPAVSGMLLEIAGIQFPFCPFSGWYALSEIATRDLLDEHRYNLRQEVADALELDSSNQDDLWQERVNTELSVAVLHSFKRAGITIVDHHTLAEQYMMHFKTEHKVRGGCPADWIWIVPPISSGLVPTFHQEMLSYHLSPSYEYQEPLWKNELKSRKRSVTGIAKALWFISSLYQKRYENRPEAYIFYGTSTGTAKMYASLLSKCLEKLFKTSVQPLHEDTWSLIQDVDKDKSLILILTSTTGNGDSPHHAIGFKCQLEDALKEKRQNQLTGLKFSVFALGSSNYEDFCAFGKFCDQSLDDLGATRIAPLFLGDDQKGQDKPFRSWTESVLKNGCHMLKLELPAKYEDYLPFAQARARKASWISHQVQKTSSCIADMKKFHGSALHQVDLMTTVLISRKVLSSRYFLVTLGFPTCAWLKLAPGDHITIFPDNHPQLVEDVMNSLIAAPDESEVVSWNECDVPPCTLKKALTSYLDLASSPSQDVMRMWLPFSTDKAETEAVEKLCQEDEAFREWRAKKPDVSDFLAAFPGVKIPAASFVASMKKLLPRSYSVASYEPKYDLIGDQIIPVVNLLLEHSSFESGFKQRFGVCSDFLNRMEAKTTFLTYHHANDQFKLPSEEIPIIMICAGSGIAPFRAFWQQRRQPNALLYFGCRDQDDNLFHEETEPFITRKVAFSRMNNERQYVQDLLIKDQDVVFDAIMHRNAHLFICGMATMALEVKKALTTILMAKLGETEALQVVRQLKRSGRLVEEFFG